MCVNRLATRITLLQTNSSNLSLFQFEIKILRSLFFVVGLAISICLSTTPHHVNRARSINLTTSHGIVNL